MKKRTANIESYIKWKYTSGTKGKSRHSRMKENGQFFHQETYFKRMAKGNTLNIIKEKISQHQGGRKIWQKNMAKLNRFVLLLSFPNYV